MNSSSVQEEAGGAAQSVLALALELYSGSTLTQPSVTQCTVSLFLPPSKDVLPSINSKPDLPVRTNQDRAQIRGSGPANKLV